MCIEDGRPGTRNLAALPTRFCSSARSWTWSPGTVGSGPAAVSLSEPLTRADRRDLVLVGVGDQVDRGHRQVADERRELHERHQVAAGGRSSRS
jgi:hypothetical protein